MPELKACPFCGGEAEFTDDYYGNGTGYQNVFCTNCGAGTAYLKPLPDGSCDHNVIERWNRRASDWIPCSERLPENETEVLIFCPDFCDRIKKAMFIEDKFYEERTDLIVKPGEYCTHWMPLPEPPKEVQHVD